MLTAGTEQKRPMWLEANEWNMLSELDKQAWNSLSEEVKKERSTCAYAIKSNMFGSSSEVRCALMALGQRYRQPGLIEYS